MNDTEQLTVLNSRGETIGTADRRVIHEFALWHPTFISLLYDEEGNSVIFQIKSKAKQKTNDKEFEIDFSACGHITADEEPQTALRELEEELGLKSSQYKAVFLGKRQSAANISLNFSEFEWQYVWLIVTSDLSLDEVKYDTNEIDGLVKINIDAANRLFNGEVELIDAEIIENNSRHTTQIGKDHFVPAYVNGETIIPRLVRAASKYTNSKDDNLTW